MELINLAKSKGFKAGVTVNIQGLDVIENYIIKLRGSINSHYRNDEVNPFYYNKLTNTLSFRHTPIWKDEIWAKIVNK